MSQQQRARNLEDIQHFVEAYKYISIQNLRVQMMIRLGITEKKFAEYIQLLQLDNRIILENGWAISRFHTGEKPWNQVISQTVKITNKDSEIKKDSEIDHILNASIDSKCPHEKSRYICKMCGEEACENCGIFEKIGNEISGKCNKCS